MIRTRHKYQNQFIRLIKNYVRGMNEEENELLFILKGKIMARFANMNKVCNTRLCKALARIG